MTGSIPGPLDRRKDPILKARQNGYFLGASAIAFLGGMTPSQATQMKAVEYLSSCADQAFWARRGAALVGFGSSPERTYFKMAKTCIGALGYIGTSEARSALLQIEAAIGDAKNQDELDIKFVASHSLRVLEGVVAEGGLSKYLYDDGNQALGKGLPR